MYPGLASTIPVLLLLLAPPPAAPPAARLSVDGRGVLRIPAATLKQLGVRRASNGMVCLQFPAPPDAGRPREPEPHAHGPDHDHAHQEAVPRTPLRVWTPLRRDGSLLLPRTPLGPGGGTVPGGAGTVYRAVVVEGRIVLGRVGGRPAGRTHKRAPGKATGRKPGR